MHIQLTIHVFRRRPHLDILEDHILELEALRERRPPWPRQIITPIFPNVIMLSLGGERLTPKVLDHDLGLLPLLWWFLFSFTHLRIPRAPPKFNQFFIVLPRTPPYNFIPIRFITF